MTTPGARTSKQLYRYLISIYVAGSVTSVGIVFYLVYLGLDFSLRQWVTVLGALPAAMCIYVIPDVYLIWRHYRPLGSVLEKIEAGGKPASHETSRAIVQALNLPYLTFLRVVLFHGPAAGAMVAVTMIVGNALAQAHYESWQLWTFVAIVFLFAAPAHAIFEYFAVSRCMVRVIEGLYAHVERLEPQFQAQLKPTGIKKKLLYLTIFVTSLPLLFLAISVTFKVSLIFSQMGVTPPRGQYVALLLWVYGVAAVCVVGAFIMSWLTAAEVTRSATKLTTAMKQVELGHLDVRLQVTSTDEYANLFRGFNLMTEELNEEVKILGVSHSLMGELQLDVLLQRIIHVTTELLDAERSTLFLHDDRTDELWSRFAEGVTKQDIRIPPHAGIAGAVFQSGVLENIPDVYLDARFNQDVDRRTGYKTRNMLAAPVINKKGVRIGVLQVLNKHAGAFAARDESRLRAFAAQIAIALENAKLFDDVLRIQNYNEAILRSTSNAMITLDNDGRIVTANAASQKLLRLPAKEIVGHTATDFFCGPNSWVMDSINKVEDTTGNDMAVGAELQLTSGDIASVNLNSVPLIDAARGIIGSMLIFEDITDEKKIKSTMSRYMSKEVVDQLLKGGGDKALGGQVQRVTVLFSDIRNFTNISEAIGARETVSLLNDYFAEMVDVVFHHKGVLDKYIGDAIMALYGAPFSGPQDANNATRTAIEMIVTLRELNARFTAAGKRTIDIGVGVNTGDAVVGSIGSPKRMEYTAIGDSVNLASRLEGACKIYGVKVILSEFTLRDLKWDFKLRELDRIRVKGKDQPVAIYEGLDHHTRETFPDLEEMMETFDHGLKAYRSQDWARAQARFETVLNTVPQDVPSRLYRERCLHFAANPPGDDWAGVWTHKEK